MLVFNFPEDYATWLPNHLEHLNEGSLDILKDLDCKGFEHVRYSTIVSIRKEKEMKTYNAIMVPLLRNVPRVRRNILESSVLAS